MCAAVVLGQLLSRLPSVKNALDAIELDPMLLSTQCYDDLVDRMTEVSRKLFAGSTYNDAFRLSDVKTRSLTIHAAARSALSGPDEKRDTGTARRARPPVRSSKSVSWLTKLRQALPSGPVLITGLALIPLALLFLTPPIGGEGVFDETQLEGISPFLERGQYYAAGVEPKRFQGELGRAWDYLGTDERAVVVEEIARHLAGVGAERFALEDADGLIVAQYRDGIVISIQPHDATRVQRQ